MRLLAASWHELKKNYGMQREWVFGEMTKHNRMKEPKNVEIRKFRPIYVRRENTKTIRHIKSLAKNLARKNASQCEQEMFEQMERLERNVTSEIVFEQFFIFVLECMSYARQQVQGTCILHSGADPFLAWLCWRYQHGITVSFCTEFSNCNRERPAI